MDIEDLVPDASADGSSKPAKRLQRALLHAETVHDLSPEDAQSVRENLVKWFDVHRRKLPWRGDPPPYQTTPAHTKQSSSKAVAGAMDAFFVQPKPESETDTDGIKQEQKPMEDEVEAEEALPRRVTPYETWVSEIMLQQTRVDTVVEYFVRWIDKFPTVQALAAASEEDVNALWAGLGYYRRARMLHSGAKFVVEKLDGQLPSTIDQLLTIPGIGPYTAGAISSIAFGNQEPLVDGNVIRVLARLRAVGADPKNTKLIKFTWKAAGQLVQHCDRPGALNQALMELGATVCTVQNPLCGQCPVRSSCLAYEEAQSRKPSTIHASGSIESGAEACSICDESRASEWIDSASSDVTKYPLKAKKADAKSEVICVAVVTYEDAELKPIATTKKKDNAGSTWRFLMAKRPENGLLAGQWEFLHDKMRDGEEIPSFAERKKHMQSRLQELLGDEALKTKTQLQRRDLGDLAHIFSHRKHHMGLEHLHFPNGLPRPMVDGDGEGRLQWLSRQEMAQLGITTGVKKILQRVLQPQETEPKAKPKPKTTASRVKKAPASHVADKPVAKRLKTLRSFFTK